MEVHIYQATDFHGQIEQSTSPAYPGAAKYSGVARKQMQDSPNAVFLLGGDNYQGTLVSNYFYGEPVAMMERRLGAEYSALGNRDYDWGTEKIYSFQEKGEYTMLAANVWLNPGVQAGHPDNPTGAGVTEKHTVRPAYVEPYGIIESGGKKIGVIGWAALTTGTTAIADSAKDVDFSSGGEWLGDMVQTLRKPAAEGGEGCDAVIGLAHHYSGMTGEANLTASDGTLQVIDGYFTGHNHVPAVTTLPDTDIPVVNAGTAGNRLALLRLTFDGETGELVSVRGSFTGTANPNQVTYPKDDVLESMVERYIVDPGIGLDDPRGVFDPGFVSRTERDFWANRLVYDYIERETGESYVYMQNSGGMRPSADVIAGPKDIVTLRYMTTLMPFSNRVVLGNISGENLIAAMDKQPDSVTGASAVDGDWFLDATGEQVMPERYYKAAYNSFMQGTGSTGGDEFNSLAPDNTPDYSYLRTEVFDAMMGTVDYRTAWSIADGNSPVGEWDSEGNFTYRYERLAGRLRATPGAGEAVVPGDEVTFKYSGKESGVSITYSVNGGDPVSVSGASATLTLAEGDFLEDTYFSGEHVDFAGVKRSDDKVAIVKAYAAADGYEPTYVGTFRFLQGVAPNITATVDIFSFNDFHGTMDKSQSASNPGADRFIAIVNELRRQSAEAGAESMVLAAGDNYQGSALSNLYNGEPVSAMLKYLGVKYSAVGIHEYDWGTDKFAKFAEDGDIEFLAANIFFKDTQDRPDYVAPYATAEIGGKKIGLIGLITAETPNLVRAEYVDDLDFVDPASAEAAWIGDMIDDLRNNQGCDAVIALTHLGSRQSGDAITGEGADLANTVHGAKFDAIITARTHQVVAGYVNGVAIVQGNYNGRGLGKLTLRFMDDDTVKVVPKAYNQNDMNSDSILPVDVVDKDFCWEPDPVEPPQDKDIGVFGQDINSRDEQARWANQLVYDYIEREFGETYIFVQNAGGWRDTSPYDRKADDPVRLHYLYALMPFDTQIVLTEMPGNYLLEILNNPDQFATAPLITGATKVGEEWYLADGVTKIEAPGSYKVSCNDLVFAGADLYRPFWYCTSHRYTGVPLRDAMIEELLYRASWKIDAVTLLDTKATVNTAREIGALIPVRISRVHAADEGGLADSPAIGEVKLEAQTKAGAPWTAVANLSAQIYDEDASYIRIDAQPGAKTTKNVRVSVLPKGKEDKAENWIEAGTLKTLTVTTQYPSIKLSVSGPLNRVLPAGTVKVTATSAEGVATVQSVSGTGITDNGNGIVALNGATRNVRATVEVRVAGYKAAYKKVPTVTVKVVNTRPGLKLSPAKVTVADNGNPVQIDLLSSKKTVAFQDGYTVKDVTTTSGQVTVAYAGGVITVTPKSGAKTGTVPLNISFEETGETVPLKLKMTVKAMNKLKPAIKPSKVTINRDKSVKLGSTIIRIPISLGVANIVADDWAVLSIKNNDNTITDAIAVEAGANAITLRVKDPAAFEKLAPKYELNIGSPSVNGGKTFKLTLNVSAKQAKIGSISLKGAIDITNPDSAVTATVKLAETTAPIESVEFLKGAAESADFKVVNAGGSTFQIIAAHRQVAPVKHTLTALVTLENGKAYAKDISITPKMGKLKASQNVKTITLYRATPEAGQAVTLGLTAPAGAKLGTVVINQAGVNKMKFAEGGFELAQSGEGEWTIRFRDGQVPTPQKGSLKTSYTLKLDLWAEGTYTEENGVVKAFTNAGGKAVTKPVTVSVKVNLA